jgi:DMSO/TMAO reductase YedYZ molybdopterin-dependent catalytic subunit
LSIRSARRGRKRPNPVHRTWKSCLLLSIVILLGHIFVATPASHAQTVAAAPELRIGGAVATPLVFTVADLKKMPRKTLSVVNPHDQKKEVYEGVLLEDLLQKAGVAHGEQLRGAAMATYILAEAEDGYRVVFSLAELDSGIVDSEVIVADTMDGAPLAAKQGPFRLVAPHEKRPARWVRMLKSISVVSVESKEPNSSGAKAH